MHCIVVHLYCIFKEMFSRTVLFVTVTCALSRTCSHHKYFSIVFILRKLVTCFDVQALLIAQGMCFTP